MPSRQLDLRSSEDVVGEIERLRTGGYDMTANWNLTQICDHLEKTITVEIEGLKFRLPWIFRATIGKFLMRRILATRRMGRLPAPSVVVPKHVDPTQEVPSIIDGCIAAFRRCASFPGPLPPHPAVDNLSVADWRELMYIHASHHLGFLIPRK